ncbi:hypothetical protein CJ030_MR1G016846 [Morella rubra]|uniref:Uncharacterized protein n=1 Tax=Morella rubra TaxID=262757 RepID=A0A6A1WRL9_9ROSI|nr:hypothetical protein CJ030_MR1G016846 [Morella rubra]
MIWCFTQSRELLELTCQGLKPHTLFPSHFADIIFRATREGIVEIVSEVLKAYPGFLEKRDEKSRTIFSFAVLCRQARIWNLLNELPIRKNEILLGPADDSGNTILHMAARVDTSAQPVHNRNAAFQMQRELQWFKVYNLLGSLKDTTDMMWLRVTMIQQFGHEWGYQSEIRGRRGLGVVVTATHHSWRDRGGIASLVAVAINKVVLFLLCTCGDTYGSRYPYSLDQLLSIFLVQECLWPWQVIPVARTLSNVRVLVQGAFGTGELDGCSDLVRHMSTRSGSLWHWRVRLAAQTLSDA